MYETIIRPLLFRLDPERVHHWAVKCIGASWLRPFFPKHALHQSIPSGKLTTELCGIPLAHPIGLAAGFDKDAKLVPHLPKLGFSYAEVGTVTAKAQVGNPKPRLFRLPRDKAIINRMGFNNDGVDAAVAQLQQLSPGIPLGGNIGKSKVTPLAEAHLDYAYSLKALAPFVDYFVVNVSSPNTPNLRELQAKEPLKELLQHLTALNESGKPLLLKIAPDLTWSALEDIVEVVEDCNLNGVIATNTTISREGLQSEKERISNCGNGGLSGAPLRAPSLEILRFLRKNLPKAVDLIGVGGIFTGRDALDKITAGASCVQIYTSLIYRGPATVALILKELSIAMDEAGFTNIADAIGSDVH